MKEISKSGPVKFVELSGSELEPFCVGSFGEPGTGKTRLIASMPTHGSDGFIGAIALDRKTRTTLATAAKLFDKRILMPEGDFIRTDNPMKLAMMQSTCDKKLQVKIDQPAPECCSMHHYRWHVNRVKDAAFRLYDRKDVFSLGLDSGSQLWEDMLFANYGRNQRIMPRDRGEVNQEMIDFLNALSGKHLIITHKAKEVWKNDKPSGEFEPAGFGGMGYYTNVLVQHTSPLKDRKGKKRKDGEPDFCLDVKMCQANASLSGESQLLMDEAITFQQLAMQVYPDSSLEDWE